MYLVSNLFMVHFHDILCHQCIWYNYMTIYVINVYVIYVCTLHVCAAYMLLVLVNYQWLDDFMVFRVFWKENLPTIVIVYLVRFSTITIRNLGHKGQLLLYLPDKIQLVSLHPPCLRVYLLHSTRAGFPPST